MGGGGMYCGLKGSQFMQKHHALTWESREKLHWCPVDLGSEVCWSCTVSLLHPLLASLLDALVPPGKWRP